MLHCPITDVLMFPPTCSRSASAPAVGGGHLKRKEGVQCCGDHSGMSAGPSRHSRLQHTLCYLSLSDAAHQWFPFPEDIYFPADVLLAGSNPASSAYMISLSERKKSDIICVNAIFILLHALSAILDRHHTWTHWCSSSLSRSLFLSKEQCTPVSFKLCVWSESEQWQSSCCFPHYEIPGCLLQSWSECPSVFIALSAIANPTTALGLDTGAVLFSQSEENNICCITS